MAEIADEEAAAHHQNAESGIKVPGLADEGRERHPGADQHHAEGKHHARAEPVH